jgi:hypothetical protein
VAELRDRLRRGAIITHVFSQHAVPLDLEDGPSGVAHELFRPWAAKRLIFS